MKISTLAGSFQPVSELHDHALAYAKFGWPVFPLAPREKVPLYRNPHPKGSLERSSCRGWGECGAFGHGVLDATTDPRVIDFWWRRTPSAGIGMACGVTHGWVAAENPASFGAGSPTSIVREAPDVLDIDVKAGARGLESLERLRGFGLVAGCWARVRTPSGGFHLYFDGTGQGNGSIRGHGVDFRSAGGYVVMPPTPVWVKAALPSESPPDGVPAWVVDHGEYAWVRTPDPSGRMPGATTGVCDWSAVRRALDPRPDPPPRGPDMIRSLDAVVDWLERQGEGNRNNALYWAVLRVLEAGGGRDDVEALRAVADRIGLAGGETDKTIQSALRRVALGARAVGREP